MATPAPTLAQRPVPDAAAVAGAQAGAPTPAGWPSGRAKLRFEVTIPAAVRAEPTTGRVFVILSRTNQSEPRLQIGRIGAPMFGRDVEQLQPGRAAVVGGSDLGHPVWDLAEIPAGDLLGAGGGERLHRVPPRRREGAVDAR
ncbi:MAG: hypothetical protein IPN47_00230 [Gemmatimonadetes bacterium]|nr:hypothetical protein [Gemmatimonadota bacterium]